MAVPTALVSTAATLPGMVLYDPDGITARDDVRSESLQPERVGSHLPAILQHELHHYRQEAELGPAFWVAYAATMGEGFEPYSERLQVNYGWREAWMPADGDDTFPLIRVEWRHGLTFSLLPGYPHVTLR